MAASEGNESGTRYFADCRQFFSCSAAKALKRSLYFRFGQEMTSGLLVRLTEPSLTLQILALDRNEVVLEMGVDLFRSPSMPGRLRGY